MNSSPAPPISPPVPARTAAGRVHPEPTEVTLRCSDTADLLAALPFLAGITAENCLFVIVFEGRRAGQTLRVDLPPQDDAAATRSFLLSLRRLLRMADAGTRGAAIVIVSSTGFAECDEAPWLDLAQRIERLFSLRSWPLRDLAVLAPDGWMGMLGERARERRGLDEISTSPIARSTAELSIEPTRLSDLTAVLRSEPRRAAAVFAELERLDREAESRGDPLRGIVEVAVLAEVCLGEHADPPLEPALCARLIRATGSRRGWIVVALTALTRARFVADLFESPAARRLLDEPTSVPEPAGRPGGAHPHRPPLHEWLIVVGQERPDERRLACATAILTDAIANAPEQRRAGMLGLLAWFWWLRGLQSVSQHFVELALASDPGSPVTRVVEHVNQAPPAWCVELLRTGRAR